MISSKHSWKPFARLPQVVRANRALQGFEIGLFEDLLAACMHDKGRRKTERQKERRVQSNQKKQQTTPNVFFRTFQLLEIS
jgi:hypothetical protein